MGLRHSATGTATFRPTEKKASFLDYPVFQAQRANRYRVLPGSILLGRSEELTTSISFQATPFFAQRP